MSKDTNLSNHTQNEISVALPEEGGFLDLNKIIRKAPDGTILCLEDGTYQIKETIKLNKSVKLVGNGIDNTFLTGKGLDLLVESKGDHHVEIEGISFIAKSETPTTGVQIDGGSLKVENSFFSANVIERNDNQGIGLQVIGNTDVEICGCRFEANENAGIWIDDQVRGKVAKNTFNNNESGLIVVGNAVIDAVENTFTHNHVSLAYDGSAKGTVEKNKFLENRGGLLIKGDATPSIINNAFNQNDGAAGFFENCNVLFEGNEITDGELSLKIGHTAKVIIRNNRIERNDQGIICVHQSNTQISENTILHHNNFGILVQDEAKTIIEDNIIKDNTAGAKFENQTEFTLLRNQITGHSYGVLATGNSQGVIKENIIKDNNKDPMGWNVDVREAADVDFDDYKEPFAEAKPVKFSKKENQWIVLPGSTDDLISFQDLLDQVESDDDIIFEAGIYNLADTLNINKPLRLIAKAPGEVTLIGKELSHLLVYESHGKLYINGIGFGLDGVGQTNVIKANSGYLEMIQCEVKGAKDHTGNKRDFGAGVLILGKTEAFISESVFTNNMLGVSVQGQASIRLTSTQFIENSYGIVFRDHANGQLQDNEYQSNSGYGLMAYDDSELEITQDSCHNNKAGFGFMNNAKASINNSLSFENEYHGFFIDNNADCTLRNCRSYLNELSGIAIFGDNQSELSLNEIFKNDGYGIEMGENAQAKIDGNRIFNNSTGIFLTDQAFAWINNNQISQGYIGIQLEEQASADIHNNHIFENGFAISQDGDQEISVGEDNEIADNEKNVVEVYEEKDEEYKFEDQDDGEEFEFENDNDEVDLGGLLAALLGSENLSNDPNIAAIPLPGEFNIHQDDDDDVQKEFEGFHKFPIFYLLDDELYVEFRQIEIGPDTTPEWIEEEKKRLIEDFLKENPGAEIEN